MEETSPSYVFNLHFVGAGYAYFSTFTIFKQYAENHREVRAPDLAITENYIEALAVIGQRCRRIVDQSDFDRWMLIRGWALVPQDFARQHMPQWLRSRTCVSSVAYGYIDVEVAAPSALSRSPSKSRRDAIKRRDSHTCLLCGATNVPITMHHVRAFSLGGETTARNLVALCEPCNQGEGIMFKPELRDQPLGDLSMVGPNRKNGWYEKLVYLSSDLMFTRCEVF